MTPKPKTDSLFRWIEERERENLEASGSSWGRVLDAGTGRHSLTWLLLGDASSLVAEVVAVTGEKPLANELLAEFAPSKTPHATPLKVHAGNWQNAKFLANEKLFDVIVAGKVVWLHFVEIWLHHPDSICARLEKLLASGGRLYLVGLQPLSESQIPAGADDADEEAGKLIQEVARTRDACLLLAGRRCYREYPIDWSHRQLEKAGLEVTNSVRLANVYGRSAITRQLEVGRRHVPMFKDSGLADSMQQALDRMDERLEEVFGPGGLPKEEQRRIRFGFDYVLAARKPIKAQDSTHHVDVREDADPAAQLLHGGFGRLPLGLPQPQEPRLPAAARAQVRVVRDRVAELRGARNLKLNLEFVDICATRSTSRRTWSSSRRTTLRCSSALSTEPFISINPDAMADALRHLLGKRVPENGVDGWSDDAGGIVQT
ncbi:unnamed protein product [Phytophthora fragariaefolia]|uniref:Unnamed protein product n=1 Tax=Phytophthora fragariaefolia TaxID=1490495 RepID=A0A9W7D3K7_9STRA|nr:unnamed protein product [Phytophthora fragariaefolia]